MFRANKYYIFLLIPVIVLFTISSTGCDPHRRGAVSGQVGAKKSMKYHSKPASAKRQRKNKY
jgi:hypothetical protein